MIARVLLALTSQNASRQVKRFLGAADLIVASPGKRDSVWERIGREPFDLVALDQALLPEPAAAAISRHRAQPGAAALVVLTDDRDQEARNRLLEAGCDAVLYSGLSAAELAGMIKSLLDKHLELCRATLQQGRAIQEPRLEDFVSASPVMAEFMGLVQRVVGGGTSLLILGETGVGKERLARAIHRASGREGAFVAVNCGALPESLLESELFGHEQGAFTGASRTRRGCFELAHQGTIFLDEIAEMPVHLQVRLLRVLQEREVQRVGAEWPLKVDVRVMAATSQELEQQVRAGRFRSDLLYRLGVVSLEVPPLRQRREDIPELVQSYINHFAAELGRDVQSIEPAALEALQRHDWPGNVRELINAIERATLLCDGPRIASADLPQAVLAGAGAVACGPPEPGGAPAALALPPAWHEQPLKAVREALIERLERMYLIAQLEATGGRIDETARRAGITPRALFDKMQRYRLRKEDFRAGRKR